MFLDNEPSLEGTNFQIVKDFGKLVVPQNEEVAMTIMKLSVDHSIKTILEEHNENRGSIIDKDHLRRHGNKVHLQPVSISELEIVMQ